MKEFIGKENVMKIPQKNYSAKLHQFHPRKDDEPKYQQTMDMYRMTYGAIHTIRTTVQESNESDDNSAVKSANVAMYITHNITNGGQRISQKKHIKNTYAKQFRKNVAEKAKTVARKTIRYTASTVKKSVETLIQRPNIAFITILILIFITMFYTFCVFGISFFTGTTAVILGEASNVESETEIIEMQEQNEENNYYYQN